MVEIIKHSNDLNSVLAWAEGMRSLEYNLLLHVLFKQIGEEQAREMDDITIRHVELVLQTEFQWGMLHQFGTNTVCIDSTHGTNQYDSKLMTLLVTNDFS